MKFQSTPELLPTITHYIVKTDSNGILEIDNLHLLSWILKGVIIVKESWMIACLKKKKLIEKDSEYLVEKVRYKGTVYETVTRWSKAMAKGEMPYLYGVYAAVVMKEYSEFMTLKSIITSLGGIMLEQFPEKQFFNVGSHPYLHANRGPLFIFHDGQQTTLDIYKNDPDKMYTLFTEEEFVHFLLKREVTVDTRAKPVPVLTEPNE
ncbi:hypothetical protein GCK72_009061 [Caenorhabditis remanei]|uniref:BRCT domain-containing protein n=1 Tax=Caenorhabditis remanei TaxID=31234 RepID=A0A6A5H1B5_CAERE|nr:hypothetical protein GCK72_009061 [Caenorhabditis remanei]KAF1760811.1 hypothetical protein GCK72_009061 [Caenorhabditis remanei]